MSRLGCAWIILGLTCSGCATVTRGTTEVLVIETTPAAAEVQIDPAGLTCKTPCNLELKRKKDYQVKITKTGYEPVEVNVLSEIAGAGAAGMAGNVLLGGIIGAGIDAASGATKKLTPNPLKVTLTALEAAPAAPVAATSAPTAAPAASAPSWESPVVAPPTSEPAPSPTPPASTSGPPDRP